MRRFAAMVCGMVLFAAASQAADDLGVARAALRDGLWEVARTHASKAFGDEAKLVMLESYAGEGRWDEVGKTLAMWTDAHGDGFDYYRAVVKGDHAAAIGILKRVGSEAGIVEAEMFEAGELAKSGDQKGAAAIWREVLSHTNLSERVMAAASVNLGDVAELRRAYGEVRSVAFKRQLGLRLGRELLKDAHTADEGAKLIQGVVKDSPDAQGAADAFLAIADLKVTDQRWNEAAELLRQAVEIWPETAKRASLQESRGWTAMRLGRLDDAMEAFELAVKLSADDGGRARAMLKTGDVLAAKGDKNGALERYRQVLKLFPKTSSAEKARLAVELWELETRGRELYKSFQFEAAMKTFDEVASRDVSRKPLMEFFRMLCLYGRGDDEAARTEAMRIASSSPDAAVRKRATLWLAKFEYNRGKWKESRRLFAEYAGMDSDAESVADALLWSARAAAAGGDFVAAIQATTRIVEHYPDSSSCGPALVLQGEALIELSRFDEAVLVFERASTGAKMSAAERARVRLLKADALYAMGADNAARYSAAYDAYSEVQFAAALSASERLVLAFKLARTLEKLKRVDEAFDQYYSQVVLAYRGGRNNGVYYDDEAKAAFSRAAFWLADECENRGQDRQAMAILELVAKSDVPAAEEAGKRIGRISTKGRLL